MALGILQAALYGGREQQVIDEEYPHKSDAVSSKSNQQLAVVPPLISANFSFMNLRSFDIVVEAMSRIKVVVDPSNSSTKPTQQQVLSTGSATNKTEVTTPHRIYHRLDLQHHQTAMVATKTSSVEARLVAAQFE